jgi:hypothetical protein
MRKMVTLCMVIIGCSGPAFQASPEPPPLSDGGPVAATTTTTQALATGGTYSATGGTGSPLGGAAPLATGGSAGCIVSPNCENPEVQPADGWICVVDVVACPAAGFPVKCSKC